MVQKQKSLSKRWPSKFRPFSIRNICPDVKIPKISQKCGGKLRFLIYFWFEKFWGKPYLSKYIFYTDGVFKRMVAFHSNLGSLCDMKSKQYLWTLKQFWHLFTNKSILCFHAYEQRALIEEFCFVESNFQKPKIGSNFSDFVNGFFL